MNRRKGTRISVTPPPPHSPPPTHANNPQQQIKTKTMPLQRAILRYRLASETDLQTKQMPLYLWTLRARETPIRQRVSIAEIKSFA